MTTHDQEWALVDRFFTDDGELDGVPAPKAFALGVEFAMFRERLLRDDSGIVAVVNPLNVDRIVKMCWNNKRHATQRPLEGFTDWVEVTVRAKSP